MSTIQNYIFVYVNSNGLLNNELLNIKKISFFFRSDAGILNLREGIPVADQQYKHAPKDRDRLSKRKADWTLLSDFTLDPAGLCRSRIL